MKERGLLKEERTFVLHLQEHVQDQKLPWKLSTATEVPQTGEENRNSLRIQFCVLNTLLHDQSSQNWSFQEKKKPCPEA